MGVAGDWCTADGVRCANLPDGVLSGGAHVLVDRISAAVTAEATVVLTGAAAAVLGIEAAPGGPGAAAAAGLLAGAGWQVGRRGASAPELSAWTTLQRDGRVLHLCLTGWVDPGDDRWPWGAELAGPGARGDALIELCGWLADFHDLVGVPFRARAGVAGVAAIRASVPVRTRPRWINAAGPHRNVADRAMIWDRDPTEAEAQLPYRHGYDAVGAYLAAAGLAELPPEPLRPTGPRVFDRKLAGYWCVPVAAVDAVARRWPLMPPVAVVRPGDETVWLSTPTVALLEDLGPTPEVRDSWTGPGRRLLRPWAERMRDATAAAAREPRLSRVLKDTVNEAIGMLGREGGLVYRPDWRHTIVAANRANLWRKMINSAPAGERAPGKPEWDPRHAWPLVVYTDCVTYASGEADWRRAAPPGLALVPADAPPRLGQFHKGQAGRPVTAT